MHPVMASSHPYYGSFGETEVTHSTSSDQPASSVHEQASTQTHGDCLAKVIVGTIGATCMTLGGILMTQGEGACDFLDGHPFTAKDDGEQCHDGWCLGGVGMVLLGGALICSGRYLSRLSQCCDPRESVLEAVAVGEEAPLLSSHHDDMV